MSDRCTVFYLVVGLVVVLSACSSEESVVAYQDTVEYDLLYSLPIKDISYQEEVKPILENRCVVCHGCYDAPCQLKLTSPEGIYRGSNKNRVYNPIRLTADSPTRLFVDAMTTEEWRKKGFETVLNEGEPNKVRNLEDSVMYRMLRQKRLYPQARIGMLSEDFDLSLDREQSCPTIDEFEDYTDDYPNGGMPYAMPDLDIKSYTTLVHWLAQGSPIPKNEVPSEIAVKQIKQWEVFLNGTTNKERLVARYLYEHLFQAHLHFDDSGDREFYRLVRSASPPGEPVEIISSRRPYNDPLGYIYYRLIRHQGSIVAKTHVVYELSEKRMQRYRELFFEKQYEVKSLPSYKPVVASNPIKTFADIPVNSRYKFLLDDARFFIEGFIKGPVCRGQVALNVIEDQFWIVFFDPDAAIMSSDDAQLVAVADYLASPSEMEDTYRVITGPKHYQQLFEKYISIKETYSKDFEPVDLKKAMEFIWAGNGENPNAALTVFRHMDSASVNYGFIGDYPETAWVIDFPVLERIHYLLVAGFDIYGNIGHQINTRLYMDFLRTEGEDYFLAFLPVAERKIARDEWYQGIRRSNKEDEKKLKWINKEYVNGYKTNNPQRELYQQLEQHLGDLAGDGDYINRCMSNKCKVTSDKNIQRVETALRQASKMKGLTIQILPDVAFVRVLMGGQPEDDLAYTMISNKSYKNVTSMFASEDLDDRRDYEEDTQTVVSHLEGSYPNFFYVVALDDIEGFVAQYSSIKTRQEYEVFVSRYGQRRTSDYFWAHADWFKEQAAREQPLMSGIFDLNRYLNR